MQKFSEWIDKALAAVLTSLMAGMVLAVTWQVITRFILPRPSSVTEELARFLLIWIGVLGAAYALRTRSHLGIDVLAGRLTGFRRRVVEILIHVCVILFAFFVMIIGGLRLVRLTFDLNQISAALGIKMGYVYLVIPLAGALIIYYSAAFMVQAISTRAIDDEGNGLPPGEPDGRYRELE
jgi:TRAP-type C4-dicarboxylate transport system permease small subunit